MEGQKEEVEKKEDYKFKCKLCDLFFKTEKRWRKHLTSRKHLDKINGIEIIPFNFEEKKPKNNKNNVDPYLNEDDKHKLKNHSIGEGININFNNSNNNMKCDFDFKNDTTTSTTSRNNIVDTDTETEDESNNNTCNDREDVASVKSDDCYEICTEKQKQILKFLVKNQEHEQIHNKLFQVIQKLSLEDLNGFSMNLINCEDIKILIKEKLIKVIKIYKDSLTKKLEKGETYFNNNLISEIIELLVV